METLEESFAEFVTGLRADEIPAEAARIVRLMALAVCGTAIAGSAEDGLAELREHLVGVGGAGQARTLVHGDRLPAAAAAQFNATQCRALDFCDAMAPGLHIGSSLIPAALAAAELAGGCPGDRLLAALAAGAEIGSRLNLSEAQYDGFDPTGVAAVFSATAAAARILGLTPAQTLHALGLAFNRCGGSFQCNVEGSLGVRVIQGWVAEAGVHCAQLAGRGITGPRKFLTGHYGYGHLYGRDRFDAEAVARDLKRDWRLRAVVFKKYPSCGLTQGVTELALALIGDTGLRAEDVTRAEVRVPPYAHRLVGHPLRIGSNPRVDAQFNAAYCVANALVRRSSQLLHFTPEQVRDPALSDLISRIAVVADASFDARGHAAVDLAIETRRGERLHRSLDIPPGFPGADLTDAQHWARFQDCLAYAPRRPSGAQLDRLVSALENPAALDDARQLVDLLICT